MSDECLCFSQNTKRSRSRSEHVAVTARRVQRVRKLAMLTGNLGKPGAGVNPLRGQNNVQGACDVGALPNGYAGYQRVVDEAARDKFEKAWGVKLPPKPGLTVGEMLNAAHSGTVKALWNIGEKVAMSDPDSQHVVDTLQHLDFLVVQELFMTETARLAGVVLPAASFAEKDGTFTSTERRVQRVRQAVDPPGAARTDWEIISDVARRVLRASGAAAESWNYESAEDIFSELAALTPSYAGITYDRIDSNALQWPVPNKDHPGTPILHTEKFSRGKGFFSPVEHQEPAKVPDSSFPFTLTTGRILQHYHTGSLTRRVPGLERLAPQERLELNPPGGRSHRQDSRTEGLRSQGGKGDQVRVGLQRRSTLAPPARAGDEHLCAPQTNI